MDNMIPENGNQFPQRPVQQIPAQPVYQAPPQPVYQQPAYQAPPQPVYQQPVYQAPPQPVYQQPVYQAPPQNRIKPRRYIPAIPLIMVIILATCWVRDLVAGMSGESDAMIYSDWGIIGFLLITVGFDLMIAGVCTYKNGRSILFACGLFVLVVAEILRWRFYIPVLERLEYYLYYGDSSTLFSAVSSLLCSLLCIVIGVAYIVNKKPFATTVKLILSIIVLVTVAMTAMYRVAMLADFPYWYSESFLRTMIVYTVFYGLEEVAAAWCFMTFTPAKELNG